VTSPATLVSLGSFTKPSVLLALIGIIVTLVLVVRNVPAGVFVGLVITAIIGVIMNALGFADMPQFTGVASTNFDVSLVGQALNGFGELFSHPQCWLAIFSLLFVDFFDTAGTLVAVAGKTKLMDENGELKNVERALLADSIGTCFGALMGTSTVTSFVESASGVGVGGRTGLTACVTGVLFLLASFLSPLLSIVTYSVTAPALVVVGIMMAQQLKGIDWDNMIVASATFITVLVMILGYSISNGIAAGFIVYAAGMIAGGKAKEVNWIVWVLSLLFIFYFAVAPK
jgi:AGZA family xanthine/uracil permease-like MFS transporter